MKTTYDRKCLCIVVVLFLGAAALVSASAGEEGGKAERTRLEQVLAPPIQKLFSRPAQSVLTGDNRVDANAAEVAWPREQCLSWLKKVVSPVWLPPGDIEFIFIRDEFDERDVVRLSWQRNGYDIEVAQTGSIFTMKLTPVTGDGMGADRLERISKAKELCRGVFNETGERWSEDERGVGFRVPVKGLSEKIASYSFEPELAMLLKDDGVVWGRPRDVWEANVQPPDPSDRREVRKQRDPNNPDWANTAYAYDYWFRMVSWWNDGKSVGFFFVKVEEGSWLPSWNSPGDNDFFRILRPHHK